MFKKPIYSRAFPPANATSYIPPAPRHAAAQPQYVPPPPPYPVPVQYVAAPAMNLQYEIDKDFYEQPRDVRRQLFVADTSGLRLRYPPTPDAQRDVINRYVQFHQIAREEMLDFWMQYVDCLLCIPAFEEMYSSDFKAWAYGRLARYLLIHRRDVRESHAYDPTCNPVTPVDFANHYQQANRQTRNDRGARTSAASHSLAEWSPPRLA